MTPSVAAASEGGSDHRLAATFLGQARTAQFLGRNGKTSCYSIQLACGLATLRTPPMHSIASSQKRKKPTRIWGPRLPCWN